MFDKLDDVLAEHADLEKQLSDPSVHADQNRARDLGRRYSELTPVVEAYLAYRAVDDDLATAKELADEDASFRDEVPVLEARREELTARLREALIPKDPNDAKDVILEVKAGEGGEESALFAGDLLRMYLRYAERQGWKTEILDATESDLGGYKDVSVAVKAKGGGVWSKLKYEGGVHRVQRVPATESQGRIHTSAAGVLVMPEAEEVDVVIDPGGQSVNTTDSAVRITHIPTGTVVSMQNEKSQLQNKEAGLRVLRARLLAQAIEAQQAEASAQRGAQIRTVDRSERVRTYNFPENRLSDHRTGFKSYNLDQILDGDLDAVIQSLIDADNSSRLAGAEQ
jgi:peptide chain release factor 1